jgi:hypothetical protein
MNVASDQTLANKCKVFIPIFVLTSKQRLGEQMKEAELGPQTGY